MKKSFLIQINYDSKGNITKVLSPSSDLGTILKEDFLVYDKEGEQEFLEVIARSKPPVIKPLNGSASYRLRKDRWLNFRDKGNSFESLVYAEV